MVGAMTEMKHQLSNVLEHVQQAARFTDKAGIFSNYLQSVFLSESSIAAFVSAITNARDKIIDAQDWFEVSYKNIVPTRLFMHLSYYLGEIGVKLNTIPTKVNYLLEYIRSDPSGKRSDIARTTAEIRQDISRLIEILEIVIKTYNTKTTMGDKMDKPVEIYKEFAEKTWKVIEQANEKLVRSFEKAASNEERKRILNDYVVELRLAHAHLQKVERAISMIEDKLNKANYPAMQEKVSEIKQHLKKGMLDCATLYSVLEGAESLTETQLNLIWEFKARVQFLNDFGKEFIVGTIKNKICSQNS